MGTIPVSFSEKKTLSTFSNTLAFHEHISTFCLSLISPYFEPLYINVTVFATVEGYKIDPCKMLSQFQYQFVNKLGNLATTEDLL